MFKFKSVFFKFVATFLLINIIAYALISFTISIIVNEYGSNVKKDTLKNACESISLYLNYDDKSFKNHIFDESIQLKKVMKLLSITDEGMLILITDENGKVLIFGGSDNIGISTEAISNDKGIYNIFDSDPTIKSTLINGSTYTNYDDMNGFLKDNHVYCAIPFFKDSIFVGSIISMSNNNDINSLSVQMINSVLISAIWIMVISFIIIYLVIRKFIAPISDISKTARNFANGMMDARVTVKGHDEIATLAEDFNNMADAMQSLEDMRRAFLANVSHDLRTPMTTISGFIDCILSGAIPPEEEKHYLETIRSEVKRLSRLVSQLLDISRLEAGERKFNIESYDICEQGREIIISNIQRLEEKSLDVQFDCEEDSVFVLADKDSIHQIFYNICDNAIKFSYPNSKYIVKIEKNNNLAYISVYNEGKGIPAEDQPFIFERFYKSDKSRGQDKTGVGLGMYIARTIIESHGQKIWLESEEGKYCKFTFTLSLDNK